MRTLAVRSARPRAGHSGAMPFFVYGCPLALALALAVTVCQGRVDAQNTISGGGSDAPVLVASGAHASYASTDVRADAAPELYQGAIADVLEAPLGGASGGGLVINATFDSSITSHPNSAAIEATINNAIGIFQSLFSDPITVSILFRYSTTAPDGSALPSGALAYSVKGLYGEPWNTYISALTADAKTATDTTANASLPGGALATIVWVASANGRAVGLNAPSLTDASGNSSGGPYDGIVTLNSSQPFQFTRPPTTNNFDALRATEHEMDEVLGLGSYLNLNLVGFPSSYLLPQDLFSWSGANVRNLASSGSRYFAIDGGATNIVGFNQGPVGDFGDWLSGPCPQANPYVQNALSCADQASDVTATSPEGINLDVIGYDLTTAATPTPGPDDSGLVPPDAKTLACEAAAAQNVTSLEKCIGTCHNKAAAAAFNGKTFDEEACEKTDAKKSCRAKYDAKAAKLLAKGTCPACLDATHQSALADQVEADLGGGNGALYCAGAVALGGDDMGFIPPDANTLTCETGVAKNVSAFQSCVETCHNKAVAAAFKSKTFDAEACESTDPKKSCRAKYDTAAAKLLAKGTCPACLDAAHQATLADQAETDRDAANGGVYCAGSAPTTPTATPTRTAKPTQTAKPTNTFAPGVPTNTPAPTNTPPPPATFTFTPTFTPDPRFHDNGDGTISDTQTGLMWEKKDEAGGLHDAGIFYQWAGDCSDSSGNCQPDAAAASTCSAATGGAVGCAQCGGMATCNTNGYITVWQWLNQLNAANFAGHSDWRLPTQGQDGGTGEFVVDRSVAGCGPPSYASLCVPPAFNTGCTPGCNATVCSCTAGNPAIPLYWSATTVDGFPQYARYVNFNDGYENHNVKTIAITVRAVR